MFSFLLTTWLLPLGCGEDDIKVTDTAVSPVEPASEDTDTATVEETDTEDTQSTDTAQDTGTTNDTADTNDTAVTDTGVVDTADTENPVDTGSVGPGPNAVADFLLPDINPSSPSLGQNISPRDYLQQISGWYFIKAT